MHFNTNFVYSADH